jgi:hypothetical protein
MACRRHGLDMQSIVDLDHNFSRPQHFSICVGGSLLLPPVLTVFGQIQQSQRTPTRTNWPNNDPTAMLVWLLTLVAASIVLAQDQYSWPWSFSPASGQCGVSYCTYIGGMGRREASRMSAGATAFCLGSDRGLGSANWELGTGNWELGTGSGDLRPKLIMLSDVERLHRGRSRTLDACGGVSPLVPSPPVAPFHHTDCSESTPSLHSLVRR